MRRIFAAIAAALLLFVGLEACDNDSDVVSKNISTDADNYKVMRQIVVYNGITDTYILEVIGYCALGNEDPKDQVSYTCKTPAGYVKDIIEKSDNTFVFVHQLEPIDVSPDYFKVTVKPTTVIPDFDVR
jgi:hypothetical protein